MIKTILLVSLSVWGFQLFASLQTTPPANSQAEDEWWAEAKARGQKVAQLKQARAAAFADISRRIQEETTRTLTNGTGKSLATLYTEAHLKAAPEYAAIQQRYDPQIAEARQHYLKFLQERKPNDPAISAATGKLRPQILYQEKAKYTEAARQNQVQGTVVVSVVFRADGTIDSQRIVKDLPDGLADEAIKAASEIVFLPAVKNGELVSVRMMIEYTFNLI